MSDIIALYIHIPFCLRKCKYCSFISYRSRESDFPSYIKALKKELSLRACVCNIGSVYFGGGTPSLLSPEQLSEILSSVKKHYLVANNAEITIEANPGTVNAAYLAAIKKVGINRLSLGIQSFNDTELTMLGRIHNAAEARDAVADARSAGFDNLNVDLIYGLPGQTIEEWRDSLEEAIQLSPEHISQYALTLEPEEPLFKEIKAGKLPDISLDVTASQYQMAENILQNHGYIHYEISNWSKPGKECRHNLVYWQGAEYLGLGVAAHSYIERRRTGNTDDIDRYTASLSQNVLPLLIVDEKINFDLEIAESIILSLRLCRGINIKDFEKQFGIDIMKNYTKRIEELREYELIEFDEGYMRLTSKGRLLGNEVFWRFLPDRV
ncbi:MAG: radical SAM family heme chaperone HemW [Dehalococcoidales bacterium]|nr:radical SAM family heme chaperone HemW [Dehalococcoidales bacterium]